ncbi:MAG TPA: bifunctional oligoribonuclease/PAP phosphatase NrnA [Bacteroidales bacterium]|nr:bifunctional oligoribonuclease/PAP phosphatase NrnA [Bacteroidales bacterium]
MKRIDNQSILEIQQRLANVQQILIVTHYNPDGDAIGSSLGMYHYLSSAGYNADVVVPNSYPAFLHWMPGNEQVIVACDRMETVLNKIRSAELIIFLDFNVLNRVQELEQALREASVPKILIDHHPNPEPFADVIVSSTHVSSTSELLYEILTGLNGEKAIDPAIAECLYAGIMTDTGSFSYNSSLPETYYVVSKLIEKGIDKDKIYWKVYDNYSVDRMRLLGYCLNTKLKVLPEYGAAYISITREELRQFNYKRGDSEGFVNYPLSISGVMFSVIFIEQKDHVKISFRSKGDFQANRFADNHFNGGGHKNAAGGYSELSMDETLKKFESLLPDYKTGLQDNYLYHAG